MKAPTPISDAAEARAQDATSYCLQGWELARRFERELTISIESERLALRNNEDLRNGNAMLREELERYKTWLDVLDDILEFLEDQYDTVNGQNKHNQCPTCGLYFRSNAAFGKHRVGSYVSRANRRCLTTTEMQEIGMAQNSAGFWVTKLREMPK